MDGNSPSSVIMLSSIHIIFAFTIVKGNFGLTNPRLEKPPSVAKFPTAFVFDFMMSIEAAAATATTNVDMNNNLASFRLQIRLEETEGESFHQTF